MARTFQIAVAAVLALAVAAAPSSCRPRRGTGPPNVLVVVLDTVRADRTSLFGYARPTTPALDEFARSAVTFDDAWSQGSWTVPSHVALFTGCDTIRVDWTQGRDIDLKDSTTLAERLSAAGWETGAFSANPWVGPAVGLTRGFAKVEQEPPRGSGFAPAETIFGAALAWIRERADGPKPFFAYVNVMEPHAPYDPPPEETALFVSAEHRPRDVAEARTLHSGNRFLMASLRGIGIPNALDRAVSDLYDAEIAHSDGELGKFLDAVRAEGLLDDALVVIASDHGEGLGDHGWREHGLRLHRELLHVPLVVRFPQLFDGGRRVHEPVRLMDVHATVLARCGVPVPEGLDSRDLADLSVPRTAFATDRPYAGWNTLVDLERDLPTDARKALETRRLSLYDGKRHLITDASGASELYDPAADPAETRDLSQEEPETLEAMRSILRAKYGLK